MRYPHAMQRPGRHLVHFAMWLFIALLPLRGWANVVMQMAPVPGPAPMHMQAQTVSHTAVAQAMPCHGSPAQDGAASADQKPCSACDVCHSVALTASAMATSAGSFLPPLVARISAADASALAPPLRRPPIA